MRIYKVFIQKAQSCCRHDWALNMKLDDLFFEVTIEFLEFYFYIEVVLILSPSIKKNESI
jgi:hypothetical protein